MRAPLLLAALSAALALPATAGGVIDPKGLVRMPVDVHNSGSAPLLCQAEIAHWFATDLAAVAPDATASLDLRFDTATGAWAAMNARGEALPLQRAWCGEQGRAYETRFDLALGPDHPHARRLECRAQDGGVACK